MSSFSWILNQSEKLDAALRDRLYMEYAKLGEVPASLVTSTFWLLERLVKVPVIIQFKEEMTDASINELKVMTNNRGYEKSSLLRIVNGLTASLSLTDLQTVCQCERVSQICLDREGRILLNTAATSIGSRAAQASGFTGRGVTVAVIDTGIYPHPDVYNQIIGFRDFINNRRFAYDDHGHGTHCAGDVASNGSQSGGRYVGPAPEARLVGVKVADYLGRVSTSTFIQGVEWCVQNRARYGIRVLTISIGFPATSTATDPVAQAVERAWDAGLVVCCAAGNSGPNGGTIATPGTSPKVITVGAADDRNTVLQTDDFVATFSSRGPTPDGVSKPDVVAPGVDIISLRAPDSLLDLLQPSSRVGTWYYTLSGTSMATPIVAGLAAQLLQVNPNLTPDQVKSIIMRNALPLAGYGPYSQGAGEVRFPPGLLGAADVAAEGVEGETETESES